MQIGAKLFLAHNKGNASPLFFDAGRCGVCGHDKNGLIMASLHLDRCQPAGSAWGADQLAVALTVDSVRVAE